MPYKRIRSSEVEAGDIAHHLGQLDPREVAEVSADKQQIKLKIGARITDWIRRRNYTFTRFYKEN